jgi:hypothetical protein
LRTLQPSSREQPTPYLSSEGFFVYVLRSLYFQWLLAEQPPTIASELLPALLRTLSAIDPGFYRLP